MTVLGAKQRLLSPTLKDEQAESRKKVMENASATQRNIWVVGYPRSGNTWVNYLCAYCLNLPFQGFDDGAKAPKQDWVRHAVSGKHPWRAAEGFHAVMKTHKLPHEVPFKNGCVIYVQRDPRDVFVSYSYYMEHRSTNRLKKIRYKLLGMGGKSMQLRWFLTDWKKHFTAWRPHTRVVIQYEKVVSQGAPYLAQCLRAAGFNVTDDLVAQALDYFRFEKMSGREMGVVDEKSFFRRGGSGDWKNHLTEEENRIFTQALSDVQLA